MNLFDIYSNFPRNYNGFDLNNLNGLLLSPLRLCGLKGNLRVLRVRSSIETHSGAEGCMQHYCIDGN